MPRADMNPRRFAPFFAGLLADLRMVAFGVAVLGLFRGVLLLLFRSAVSGDSGASTLLKAFGAGLRFDAQAAFYLALPGLAFGVAGALAGRPSWGPRARAVAVKGFCWLFPLLAVLSIGFVREFGDLFNHFVFGLIYDDARAVALTVWQEHPVVWELSGSLAAGWLFARLAGSRLISAPPRYERWAEKLKSPAARAAGVALALVLLALAARGGAGRVPVQFRDRDVTTDAFVNRMVLNPLSAFRYAVRDHLKAMDGGDAKRLLGEKGPRAALDELFPHERHDTFDAYFRQRAKGPKGVPPRHIFLIVGESYDAWPLLPAYRPLGLMPESEKLAAEGIWVRSFLSASTGTMTSLSCLMSGLYSPELRINYQASSRTPYATAPGVNFKALGYRTQLFYGGRLSWQRIGEFARAQGFDETYGQEHIAAVGSSNEWGVDDRTLFDFALATVRDDAPTFSLLLTTSNHPPYSVDLAAEGWKGLAMPPELENVADGHLSDREVGHIWYADREVGRFARAAAGRFPASLVAATGDHFGRRFLNRKPNAYEGSAVPLLLYGPEALAGITPPERMAGSHLDIAPTLIELAAPAGFEYSALGRDLLAPEALPIGYGRDALIGPDFIAPLEGEGFEPLPWTPPGTPPPRLDEARRRFARLAGLSWWRVMKGNVLPE